MNRIIILLSAFLFSPSLFAASDVIVYPDDKYASIQEAIDALAEDENLNTVELLGGEYVLTTPLLIPTGVTLRGKDTEQTILTASVAWEGQVLIVIAGASNVRIRNLKFENAELAIRFENGPSFDIVISNNVFVLGKENRAIEILDSSTTTIENNVFYNNEYAIVGNPLSGSDPYTIRQNIFLDNKYLADFINTFTFLYNCYWPNYDGLTEIDENSIQAEPQFARIDTETNEYDFHLKTNSPCRNVGDENSTVKDALDNSRLDFGAYGGPGASVYPPPVSFDVSPGSTDDINYSMSFSWKPLAGYEVDNAEGGYKIYFGDASNSYDFTSGTQVSPIENPSTTTGTDGKNLVSIEGFQTPAVDLSSPADGEIKAYNQRLDLSWSAVDGATGYQLVYVGGNGDTDTLDVENVTSHTLSGLTNGVNYTVSIQPYAQPTLYFYIKAIEGLSADKHESLWYQKYEKTVELGDKVLSNSSMTLSATPDEIRPYPVLPNEGCFIATATYGSYDAKQVQIFRDFRDQFLLTNAVGAEFVKLYYQYGPAAASYLNEHPVLKPVMQALLYPYLLLASTFVDGGAIAGSFYVLLCFVLAGLLVFVFALPLFRREKYHVI
ncbi:MAG: right-handed parallel beta-helix repeat-containing protein [Gammaproteobacteria bacterium]|nr:right-handed parallel beta-helix repeat-containing protein [Gammaproteobacteria bacterium]